jgi:hypothetical protein
VISHNLSGITLKHFSDFGVLQSRIHEVWARFFGSSLEDRLGYNPSDCFETFPFPAAFESIAELEDVSRRYYELRSSIMVRNCEGLTKTYARFHDPNDTAFDVVELRQLHDSIDRLVLGAYGWDGIGLACEFYPEFDDEEEEEEGSTRKRRRFRYRWSDDTRDEILARLLVLNQERYEAEVLAGMHEDDSQDADTDESVDDEDEDQGKLNL